MAALALPRRLRRRPQHRAQALLGVGFPGEPARVEWLPGHVEVAAPPRELAAMAARVPGAHLRFGPARHEDGVYRFVVRSEEAAEDRSVPPTLEEFKQRLQAISGTDLGVHSPRWLTRFGDATGQAERCRIGRVLLAGDAAHIHQPMGLADADGSRPRDYRGTHP